MVSYFQKVTERIENGNLTVLATVDGFSRYKGAKAVTGAVAKAKARTPMEKPILVFGPSKSLLSSRDPNLEDDVTENLKDTLETGRMQTNAFPPMTSETLERCKRRLVKDLACIKAVDDSDYGDHVAIDCFRYSTEVCATTGTMPSKAVFVVEAFGT